MYAAGSSALSLGHPLFISVAVSVMSQKVSLMAIETINEALIFNERYSKPFSEFASQFPWVG
jgi:hypothetical protein